MFTVTINSITGSEPAELNDEFVAQFGSASVEEFRNTVIVALEEDALATYEEELQMQIIDKLLAECVFAFFLSFTGVLPPANSAFQANGQEKCFLSADVTLFPTLWWLFLPRQIV